LALLVVILANGPMQTCAAGAENGRFKPTLRISALRRTKTKALPGQIPH
jgi:hypothetical protein